MTKDTKIIHVQVVEGTQEQIGVLGKALKELKDKLPFDVEFMVTNDAIQLRDVKYLIDELYTLYKQVNEGKNDKE